MLGATRAYSGFSSNDIAGSKAFYGDTLGIPASEENGMLSLRLPGGGDVLIYPKDDHRPATYTVLNFEVPNIEAAVDALVDAGVRMERYEGFEQDERGIHREFGSPIAWFKDPAGNILAVLEAGA